MPMYIFKRFKKAREFRDVAINWESECSSYLDKHYKNFEYQINDCTVGLANTNNWCYNFKYNHERSIVKHLFAVRKYNLVF